MSLIHYVAKLAGEYMEIESFPYRLDTRARNALAGIMQALVLSNAKLQSASTPMTLLFGDKENSLPLDAQIWMGAEGIALVYPLNNVAKADPRTLDWLKKYNAFIAQRLTAIATPAAERCTVMVEATYSGQLKYYFSYMMRYADDSFAQDMPQGRLYATEPLLMSQTAQAEQAKQVKQAAQASEQEEISWL